MPPTDLAVWLQKNMDDKNWGVRETARRARVSHPTISDILNGGQASFDTCKALAKLFHVQPEFVLRLGRLLDPIDPEQHMIEEISAFSSALPREEQIGVLEFVKMRVRIAEERGEYSTGPRTKRKPATSGSD